LWNPALRHAVPNASQAGNLAEASWTQLKMLDTIVKPPSPQIRPVVFLMVGATGIEPVTPTMSR
jgi:hypothetical protein